MSEQEDRQQTLALLQYQCIMYRVQLSLEMGVQKLQILFDNHLGTALKEIRRFPLVEKRYLDNCRKLRIRLQKAFALFSSCCFLFKRKLLSESFVAIQIFGYQPQETDQALTELKQQLAELDSNRQQAQFLSRKLQISQGYWLGRSHSLQLVGLSEHPSIRKLVQVLNSRELSSLLNQNKS